MVAKEFYYSDQEAGHDHSNEESTLLHDPYDEYEEEETLSLCDLPIYSSDNSSNSAQWGAELSKEDGKNSDSNNKDDDFDDFFEFFSEEFTTTTPSTLSTADELIFCGKLIPFKDHHHQQHVPQRTLKNSNSGRRSNSQKGSVGPLFLPNSVSSKPSSKAVMSDGNNSMGKVKLVRSTTKARWFLFMFGMSKLSTTEMQLRDMRNRQSRRAPASMFPAPEEGKEVKNKGRRSFKGMWKMLTSISLVLGCHSSRKLANDVVKAAFV